MEEEEKGYRKVLDKDRRVVIFEFKNIDNEIKQENFKDGSKS